MVLPQTCMQNPTNFGGHSATRCLELQLLSLWHLPDCRSLALVVLEKMFPEDIFERKVGCLGTLLVRPARLLEDVKSH
jgi:hypothetical protein